MFDSEFITQVEAVADSLDADTMEPQHAIDAIRLLKQIIEKRRDYGNMMSTRRILSAEQHMVREAWLKKARKAWVAALPSPIEVGLSPLARCGDYADETERPTRRYYTSSCSHKAKYATTAKRWATVEPGPMRVYCGVHANEIANGAVTFPLGEERDAIYREQIEDLDKRREIARV
jgi:hypothetical protein